MPEATSRRPLTPDDEGRLINDLLPLAVANDERLINLVNIGRTGPLLRYAIANGCQVLYENEPTTFARLRAYAFKQYIETKPLYEERAKRLRQVLARK